MWHRELRVLVALEASDCKREADVGNPLATPQEGAPLMALGVHNLELAQHLGRGRVGSEARVRVRVRALTTYWRASSWSHLVTEHLWQAHAHKGAVRRTNDGALLVPHHTPRVHVRDTQLQPRHCGAELEPGMIGAELCVRELATLIDVVRARARTLLVKLGLG